MKVHIDRLTLEPGTHAYRKTLKCERVFDLVLPDDECKEVRPDWGEYEPVVSFPAIERALIRRGFLREGLTINEEWSFGIENS
jgi:hypothetical protein